MTLDHVAMFAQAATALFLFVMGAIALLTSGSVGKRLMGLAALSLASLYALAAFGAPQSLLIAAALAALCQIALGVALMVRLKEDYGSVEARDLDDADRDSERTDQT